MAGGAIGAAENQSRSFAADGGFEGLEGAGQPLPERNPPPFLSREEQVLNDIVDHLTRERSDFSDEDKATYKKSALLQEIAEQKKK